MSWGGVAAGVGALLGGAATAYGASQSGGGGSGSRLIVTDPSIRALGDLFGMVPGKYGWLQQGSSIADEMGLRSSIVDYASNPLPLTSLEESALPLGESVLDMLPGIMQGLQELSGIGMEAARTGFRTDINPVIQFAQRTFENELLPMIRERAGPGSGILSTGFTNATTSSAEDIAKELGALQVQLDEAASGRRLQAAPLAANLLGASAALPLNLASDLFGLGSQYRGAQEERRARPLNVFSGLLGRGAGGSQQLAGSYPTQNATAQTLGALSDATKSLSESDIDWGSVWNGIKGIFGQQPTYNV